MHTHRKPIDIANEKAKDTGLMIVHFSRSRHYHIYKTNSSGEKYRITTEHTIASATATLAKLAKKYRKMMQSV